MARTKNDFAWFNWALSMPNDLVRPNWFHLVYFPFVLGLYLVLRRGAWLDPNAARVKVRDAAKAMLVLRRYEWKLWEQVQRRCHVTLNALEVASQCMVRAFRNCKREQDPLSAPMYAEIHLSSLEL